MSVPLQGPASGMAGTAPPFLHPAIRDRCLRLPDGAGAGLGIIYLKPHPAESSAAYADSASALPAGAPVVVTPAMAKAGALVLAQYSEIDPGSHGRGLVAEIFSAMVSQRDRECGDKN